MATQLFLRDTVESGVAIGSFDEFKLRTTRGDTVLETATVVTTASGNHKVLRIPAGADLIWLYRVNAVTIASTITFNLWGFEDVMSANAGSAAIVSRYDSAGTFVSDVVAQANAAHADGVEFGTAPAVMTWTATPTSTAFSAGDWLAVVVHADAVGTMGAGNAYLRYNGDTGGVSGDSYVTFTETITEYVVAGPRVPRATPYPQILAHMQAYKPRRAFLDGLWRPNRRLVPA